MSATVYATPARFSARNVALHRTQCRRMGCRLTEVKWHSVNAAAAIGGRLPPCQRAHHATSLRP